ncbi:transposase family protein [Streptomyces sp. NPDC060232]|uniref:transposase family protein n=1 Tax=Streptomyces sp. NPDC060232 TaxID=3347079 RepID=UPI003664FF1C
MCRQSATVCLVKSPALDGVAELSLVERLRLFPDPRRRRGVRHPFVAVLLVAASAVVAGARSYAAMGQWSASAPQHALARLGARVVGALSVRVAPSAATIRRIVGLACPGGLADLSADPAGSDSGAIDGKAARGSRHGQTPAAHLLAAMTGDGRTVTQLRVPDKTNEITCFAALLAPFDLMGVTVTADALHTQRAHVRFLVEEKKAHYPRRFGWGDETSLIVCCQVGEVTLLPGHGGVPARWSGSPGSFGSWAVRGLLVSWRAGAVRRGGGRPWPVRFSRARSAISASAVVDRPW